MGRRLKPQFRRLFIAILVLLGGLFIWLLTWAYHQYDYRFGSAVLRSGTIRFTPELSYDERARLLVDSGFVASVEGYKDIAQSFDLDGITTGNYKLTEGESYRTLLTRLFFGRQLPVRVTFHNIRTLDRLAGALSRNLLVDSVELLEHLKSEADTLGKATYISMFIPNTYELYWTVSPQGLTQRLYKEHEKFWDAKGRRAKAKELGYTPEQISTIASIVYEETKVEREMDEVAGVYVNRLKIGMPLQADPTVKFAVGDFTIRRVLNRHLTYDSPYNTYRNAGLPPGPICIPPISAIDATLDYVDAPHSYLYFCANPDFSGTHIFAKSLPEHNRNAAAYHRELNRRRIL